jgi:hypothetical protein
MGVYFITDGEMIKIGFTAQSPQKRLAALQTGSPKPLSLLAFTPEWGRDKELELHQQFARLRITGEWFKIDSDIQHFLGEAIVSPFDIRKLEDHQIIGKKAGFAEERIRRTVAAIQDYNAGRELEEQIEINVGSIRKLAGANATKVGEWVKAHAAELESYAAAQGHPYGPNSKFNRGKDLLSLVPLAWNQ